MKPPNKRISENMQTEFKVSFHVSLPNNSCALVTSYTSQNKRYFVSTMIERGNNTILIENARIFPPEVFGTVSLTGFQRKGCRTTMFLACGGEIDSLFDSDDVD